MIKISWCHVLLGFRNTFKWVLIECMAIFCWLVGRLILDSSGNSGRLKVISSNNIINLDQPSHSPICPKLGNWHELLSQIWSVLVKLNHLHAGQSFVYGFALRMEDENEDVKILQATEKCVENTTRFIDLIWNVVSWVELSFVCQIK